MHESTLRHVDCKATLVYVVGAELVLHCQVQGGLPLLLADQPSQLILRVQLSDAHQHPPPHHCGGSALLLPSPKRPAAWRMIR